MLAFSHQPRAEVVTPSWRRKWRFPGLGWAVCAVIAGTLQAAQAPADGPGDGAPVKRVLVLQSFGGDFAPYNVLSSGFRSELAMALDVPVEFQEVSVFGTQSPDADVEQALIGYLTALRERRQPDLVVSLGGPAGRFALANRDHLIGSTPALFVGIDRRLIPAGGFGEGDSFVPLAVDLPALAENILQVLPAAETIAVILGISPIERFWRAELGRELRPFEERVRLVWWDDLSAEEILARAAALPENSAILYTLFLVDGDGVPHANQDVLDRLNEVTRAPIFGLFDSQLGEGIVGGPLLPVSSLARLSAGLAASILLDEPLASRVLPPVTPEPIFDGRELVRWKIPEDRLPPGSTVRFRPPSPWVEYRAPILAILLVVVIQAGLVVGLLLNRSRLRTAEAEVRDLSRRLLTAFEDERRWLARELHDDIAQRLARVAIDTAQLEGAGGPSPVRDEIGRLSVDVHSLSRRLHPSLLDNLGLEEALRAEAVHFAETTGVDVEIVLEELRTTPTAEVALCLFRIAQESLRNSGRHARAGRVWLTLENAGSGTKLVIRDDGIGFNPGLAGGHSIGLASMRERAHLAGGRLEILSGPGRGTTVQVWVPADGGES